MAAKTHELKLNGRTYSITSMPAWEGFEVAQTLADRFLGPVGTLVSAAVKASDMAKLDIGPAFADIAKGLGAPNMRDVVKSLLETLTCDGKMVGTGDIFQAHFAENYGELTAVIAFALEKNFRSFFSTGPVADLFRAIGAQPLGQSILQAVSTSASRGSSPDARS